MLELFQCFALPS